MNKDDTKSLVDKFITDIINVQHLQMWMINTADHLRQSIARGDADPGLLPMAEYFERQSNNLNEFVKELDNAPNIKLGNTVPKIDPNLN